MKINRFYSVVEVVVGNFRTFVLIHFKLKRISIVVSNDLNDDDYRQIVSILSGKYGISGFVVDYCTNFVLSPLNS